MCSNLVIKKGKGCVWMRTEQNLTANFDATKGSMFGNPPYPASAQRLTMEPRFILIMLGRKARIIQSWPKREKHI